ETSANEPMTVESAVDRLNAIEAEEVTTETTADPETVEAEEVVEEAATADEEESSDASPTQDEPTDAEIAHGNMRTRLRDGSEVTVGDLKKRADRATELEREHQAFENSKREFEAKQAQIAASEQSFQQLITQAKAVVESRIPPEPDPALLESDPIEYLQQKGKRDAALAELNKLNEAERANAQEAHNKRTAEHQARIQKEGDLLREKAPEFADPKKAEAFWSELKTIGAEAYGFKETEFGNVSDHRVLLMARDAIAYRKIQAEKAKALDKVKDAPPVQATAPGRRVSQSERESQVVKEGMNRLRTTGSFDDALAILNAQS
ncbi:hypothetical protein AB0L20_32290, partial [Streptomyces albidoflavus]|uniref:hypothetical protein n=1 Tax=Streptomyces albidoflavus TaxID=1886 RepID=UPI003443345C